jgi:hypothetical protein
MDPTAEDRSQALEVLLGLLARQTDPRQASTLADATASLSLTVADLGGSDTWPFPPTPALLAAARRNSELSAWLTFSNTFSVRMQRS